MSTLNQEHPPTGSALGPWSELPDISARELLFADERIVAIDGGIVRVFRRSKPDGGQEIARAHDVDGGRSTIVGDRLFTGTGRIQLATGAREQLPHLQAPALLGRPRPGRDNPRLVAIQWSPDASHVAAMISGSRRRYRLRFTGGQVEQPVVDLWQGEADTAPSFGLGSGFVLVGSTPLRLVDLSGKEVATLARRTEQPRSIVAATAVHRWLVKENYRSLYILNGLDLQTSDEWLGDWGGGEVALSHDGRQMAAIDRHGTVHYARLDELGRLQAKQELKPPIRPVRVFLGTGVLAVAGDLQGYWIKLVR